MSGALAYEPSEPAIGNNLECQLCHRPFAPDSEARTVWRTDPLQPLPMACPHCRATNMYRFSNMVIPPKGVSARPVVGKRAGPAAGPSR